MVSAAPHSVCGSRFFVSLQVSFPFSKAVRPPRTPSVPRLVYLTPRMGQPHPRLNSQLGQSLGREAVWGGEERNMYSRSASVYCLELFVSARRVEIKL